MRDPDFHLEGVVREKDELRDFEGPLSLILMLLSKNKIEIRDIKISDILDQYLDYLASMQSMDLEIASEFVQMASHLLYIKTKMLLSGEKEEVSELDELISSLENLKARDRLASVRELIPELKAASELGLLYFEKQPEPLPKQNGVYEYRHEPVELLRALAGILRRGARVDDESAATAYPRRIVYSVHDKCGEILKLLRTGGASTLRELYADCASGTELVAVFLSVLELCCAGSLTLTHSGDDYTLCLTDIEPVRLPED